MFKANESRSNRDWNQERLINLSNILGQAYLPGLNARSNENITTEEPSWTTDKLIAMSRHLSSAYGVDF